MTKTATIVSAHGQRGRLEANGEILAYLVPRRGQRVVCGDRVRWTPQGPGQEVLIEEIESRTNALVRPDARGRPEVLASNLDQLLVMLAPVPEPDPFVADRYLCAGTLAGCATGLVWNKCDLKLQTASCLDEYRDAGYPVRHTSAHTGEGLDALCAQLAGNISVLVGQSGVGKSSLINALVPEAELAVGRLAASGDEGTHTTTASAMYTLPGGGRLIDSPGVREFKPLVEDPRQVQVGFPEIHERATDCRFGDCQHLREPDCAVRGAVEAGHISPRRYESYRRLDAWLPRRGTVGSSSRDPYGCVPTGLRKASRSPRIPDRLRQAPHGRCASR